MESTLEKHLIFCLPPLSQYKSWAHHILQYFYDHVEPNNPNLIFAFGEANGYDSVLKSIWQQKKGIENNGQSYTTELISLIDKHKPAYLSILGGCYGAVLGRYVIGQLYKQQEEKFVNKQLQFKNFVSLASPQMGTNKQLNCFLAGCTCCSKTTRDLDANTKILEQISTDFYLEALSLFEKRILVAPIFKDPLVNFETAGLEQYTPDFVKELRKEKDYKKKYYGQSNHIHSVEVLVPDNMPIQGNENQNNEAVNLDQIELQKKEKNYNKKKYYQCKNQKLMKTMDNIYNNLRSLEWIRINVLLHHELLVNWNVKGICCKWGKNSIERPEKRLDVIEKIFSYFL